MSASLEIESLTRLPFFQELNPAELKDLAAFFFEKSYPQNATLFVEGMEGGILYVVKSGAVQILKKLANNQEALLATLKEGAFLGEMSLIEKQPRSATARVVEGSTLLAMTKGSFDTMMRKHPGIALKILLAFLKITNDRLDKANAPRA